MCIFYSNQHAKGRVNYLFGSSLKELVDEKDSRGQGFEDSSEMLKF